MINFNKFELENGLRVIVHEDNSTPMAAFNITYDVGSRDESPDKTGFAHLFEHLMFAGSKNIPDFDEPIQQAGGDNNAFTNQDITSFHITIPAENIETAFWLESDRMKSLNINAKSLKVQKNVVVEEFKETCLNEPYGDIGHLLWGLCYEKHPYRWPVIGLAPEHIEKATLADVKDFYRKHYLPNNAVLTIAGNVKTDYIKKLTEKWFSDIPKGDINKRVFLPEPLDRKPKRHVHYGKVPVNALYIAFMMPGRMDDDFYAIDLLSDVLGNGDSSRLHHRLLKEQRLFTHIDASITGSVDPGLLIIEGKPADGVTMEQAEKAIWKELEIIKKEQVTERELQKLKNKLEREQEFYEMSVLGKAIGLGVSALLGNPNLVNEESAAYNAVTTKDIQKVAHKILCLENCNVLYYMAEKGKS